MRVSIISVIMLTYNRKKLIVRAIESILAQTFCDFEFIIINNGSTDGSAGVVDAYAARDGRIRIIHHENNKNIGAARNVGLDAATGEYVAFVDDDDWCEPDFLEFLLALIQEYDADVAICGAADKVFDEKLLMQPEDALMKLMWRKHYNAAFPTKLFTRKLANEIRFPEADKFDDISQMYKLLGLSERVAYHGLPKYTFYRHDTNNSAWTTNHELLNSDTLSEYLTTYSKRTKWLCERFPSNTHSWLYFEWSFMISMVDKISRLGITGCGEQLEIMLKELAHNRGEFLCSELIQDFERTWVEMYVGEGVVG